MPNAEVSHLDTDQLNFTALPLNPFTFREFREIRRIARIDAELPCPILCLAGDDQLEAAGSLARRTENRR